jgi:hypothetical protein
LLLRPFPGALLECVSHELLGSCPTSIAVVAAAAFHLVSCFVIVFLTQACLPVPLTGRAAM